ncbi:MAG: hypothetical protein JW725_02915 [Candidatus Babeliaceae bacterium]|nr:hypothetical protein [Candidatus Babeliaceae bacterium]
MLPFKRVKEIAIFGDIILKDEIYYATGNAGKFADVASYAKEHQHDITIKQFDCELVEPQSMDQRFIALEKGRQAWNILQKPVLVDDSAIYFEKYHQFPGVYSKFVSQGLGISGIRKLVNPGDRAYFQLHLIFFYGKNIYQIFENHCYGTVVHQDTFIPPASLPYDQIFVPDGSEKTYAQLRLEGNGHLFDYRIEACRKFFNWLTQNKL